MSADSFGIVDRIESLRLRVSPDLTGDRVQWRAGKVVLSVGGQLNIVPKRYLGPPRDTVEQAVDALLEILSAELSQDNL